MPQARRFAVALALAIPALALSTAAAPKPPAEPVGDFPCNKYKDPVLAECNAFVALRAEIRRDHAAEDVQVLAIRWAHADQLIPKAGRFLDTDYGRALLEEMARKRQGGVDKLTAVAIAPDRVKAVSVAMKSDAPVCPGEERLFVVSATLTDGTTTTTWTDPADKGGHADPSAFVLTSKAGRFALDNVDGRWTFFADGNPVPALGGYTFDVAVKDRPDVKGTGTAPIGLGCMKGLYITGQPGTVGVSNATGGDGGHAGEATVDVGLIAAAGAPSLLMIKGVSPLKTWWYAGPYDPSRKIEVQNAGGKGGDGASSNDDWGFAGGNGGDGGKLVVRYDKRHPELAAAIAASAPGGAAGLGGRGTPGPGRNGVAGRPGPAPTIIAVDPKGLFVGDGLTLK